MASHVFFFYIFIHTCNWVLYLSSNIQPVYQEHYSETRTSVSPSAGPPSHHMVGYNGISNNTSSQYQNQGAIPRQLYNGTNMVPSSAALHQQQLNTASNLSELDSLLQDLSSARYNGNGYNRKGWYRLTFLDMQYFEPIYN